MEEKLKIIFEHVLEEINKDGIKIPCDGDNIVDYYIKACFYVDKKNELTSEQVNKFLNTPVEQMPNLYLKYFCEYYTKAGLGYFESNMYDDNIDQIKENPVCGNNFFSDYGLSIKLVNKIIQYKLSIMEVIKSLDYIQDKKTLDLSYSLINLLCIFHTKDNLFKYIDKYLKELSVGNANGGNDYIANKNIHQTCNYYRIIHDLGNAVTVDKMINKKYISLFMQKPTALQSVGRVFTTPYFESMPHTLAEFNTWFDTVYKVSPVYMFTEYSISEEERAELQDYISKTKTPKRRTIPEVNINTKGYELKTVPIGHVDNLMIGKKVNCCQHYFGAGAQAATFAYESENGYIWAVYKGYKIVAQALLWEVDGNIVIDSIESLIDKGEGGEKIADIFYEACRELFNKNNNIKSIYIGDAGYGVNVIFKEKYTNQISIDNKFHKSSKAPGYTNDSKFIVLVMER